VHAGLRPTVHAGLRPALHAWAARARLRSGLRTVEVRLEVRLRPDSIGCSCCEMQQDTRLVGHHLLVFLSNSMYDLLIYIPPFVSERALL